MNAPATSIPTVIKQHAFGSLTTPQALQLLATSGVVGVAAWRMLRDPVRSLDGYDAAISLATSLAADMLERSDDAGEQQALALITAHLAATAPAWSTDF